MYHRRMQETIGRIFCDQILKLPLPYDSTLTVRPQGGAITAYGVNKICEGLNVRNVELLERVKVW